MRFNPKDLIKKGGVFSRPALILMAGWIVIWIWYSVNGFPFLKDYLLHDYVAVPFLTLVCGYYFGKYNFSAFTSESEKIFKTIKPKK